MNTADSLDSSLQTTPLHAWHRDAGAKLVPFAGYEMPLHYTGEPHLKGIVDEHKRCRESGVLFDVSHMGRLRFDGEQSGALLDHLLTRRVSDLPLGRTRYAMICNVDGGVLDDVLVSNVETPSGKRYHLLVVNASNRAKILKWLEPHLADFPTVTLTDRTELTAMIAVQGPRVLESVAKLFRFDPTRLKNYEARVTDQFGKPAIVSRTGYTGEDGLELVVRAEEAKRVWENVLLAGREAGLQPAGLGARDTLRLEAAMPLYGHELTDTVNPLEAGLSFAVNLMNGDGSGRSFIGDEALRSVAKENPQRQRIGLLPEGKRPAREGCDVLNSNGEKVGVVTSGGPSPTLGYPIAMALVDTTSLGEAPMQIDIRGTRVPALPTPLPFYKRTRKTSAS
ncbi:MAG: glycine cleavage system aminomethyltransferase GcvT [Planctomycetota bacterium]